MSDVLRPTESEQTAGTPNDRAGLRDEHTDASAASEARETAPGPARETASGTDASPMERPGDPDYREPGDVIYGSGGVEETEEEDSQTHDAGLGRAGMETADPHAADLETTAGTQPGHGMETDTGMRPGMEPGMEPGTEPAGGPQAQPGGEAVIDPGLMADAAQVHQRWQQIQATFVDDPRGSVERAAMLADEVLNNVMAAGQQRVAELHNGWDGDGTDTERLRNALRSYRMFIDRLAGI